MNGKPQDQNLFKKHVKQGRRPVIIFAMQDNIRITNHSPRRATIDIEGIIGVAEAAQFSEQGEQVATYEKFKEAVDKLSALDSAEITVNIRSAGGDVNDALLIHDTLCSLSGRITTRCYGYIASAATIIAQAASRGRREISSNSLYLIHRSVSRSEGNTGELSQTADLLRQTDLRIAGIYASRSGLPVEGFLALMDENGGNGRWLSPEEALAAGLVDRIVKASPIANDAAARLAQFGLPGIPQTESGRSRKNRAWSLLKRLLLLLDGDGRIAQVELQTAQHGGADTAAVQGGTIPMQAVPLNAAAAPVISEMKKNAKPTVTQPKEDPAVMQGVHTVAAGNSGAYEEDAIRLRA